MTVATNIPGAVAYSEYPDINLVDNYGKIYPVFDHNGSMDGDFSMYAYLEPGTYSVDEYNTNTVYAYGKVDSYTDTYGRTVYERMNSLGNYKSFTREDSPRNKHSDSLCSNTGNQKYNRAQDYRRSGWNSSAYHINPYIYRSETYGCCRNVYPSCACNCYY